MNYIVFYNKKGNVKLIAEKDKQLQDNDYNAINEICYKNNYSFMCYKNIDDLKLKNIPIIFFK